MARDVGAYLAKLQRENDAEYHDRLMHVEEQFQKKLWHQLTIAILALLNDSKFRAKNNLQEFYEKFLCDFEHRINPLSLTEMCLHVIHSMKDKEETLKFIEALTGKVKGSEESVILLMTEAGRVYLQNNELPAAKKKVEEAGEKLEALDEVTTVHGRYYLLSSEYHRRMANHFKFYHEALRYLGCTPLTDIPEEEQKERAFQLALAALLGPDIHNFGELLQHDILESLRRSDKAWLVDLLYAFNSGDMKKFDQLKTHWDSQPDLQQHEKALRQKICLMALMEMTFQRPANNRAMSFKEIGEKTRVPVNEVEFLVMKALSLGLVKGSIDQVEQKVAMSWVQPRVLDRNQINVMHGRLGQWCKDVRSMEFLLEDRAKEILT